MLTIPNRHTLLPAPDIFGAVDEHPSLLGSILVMESLSGRTVERTEMDVWYIDGETVDHARASDLPFDTRWTTSPEAGRNLSRR